jgi:predicted ATPase
MITGLAIRNFKNLERIPPEDDRLVRFGPLNLLIGPNGCGKTSLLQAIDFLRAFFHSSVEVYLRDRGWDYDDLPYLRQTNRRISWRLQAQLLADEQGVGAGLYEYSVSLQPRRYVGIGEEHLVWTPSGLDQPQELLRRDGLSCSWLNRATNQTVSATISNLPASFLSTLDPQADRGAFPEVLRFRDWVEGFQLFHVWDAGFLRAPSAPVASARPRLGSSGENLAAVLADLEENHPEKFRSLVQRMARLIPTFTGLKVAHRNGFLQAVIQEEGAESSFTSSQMSDGLLRLLAVASLLYVPDPPSVVLIEEPENGVHPQLLREVVQILRESTQRKPPHRSQVFVTTHSPYVLDEFRDHPEQVYCMERSQPRAGASITRLSDKPQLQQVRASFEQSLGEAWFSNLLGAGARS